MTDLIDIKDREIRELAAELGRVRTENERLGNELFERADRIATLESRLGAVQKFRDWCVDQVRHSRGPRWSDVVRDLDTALEQIGRGPAVVVKGNLTECPQCCAMSEEKNL